MKKVKEMGCEPLIILEDLSKDEKILISSLLKYAEFIVGSKYVSKDGVKKSDLLPALRGEGSRRELPTPLPHGSFTGSVGVIGHGQSTLLKIGRLNSL